MTLTLTLTLTRRPLPARICCVAALLCAACGDGNALEGSLGGEVPLNFTAVSVEVSASALSILYLRDLPGASVPDKLLIITANTAGLTLGAMTIDLTEKVASQPRGSVSRAVRGDARRDFPALLRGSITLSGAPTVGSKLSGSFTVTFGPTGGSLGAGKTAFGDFNAVVKQAGQ